MTFDFDTCPPRLGTDSQKWQKYAGRDVLPLWVADMDFKSSPAIISALQERVAHGVFGYARPVKATVDAVVDACARNYGWKIDGSWIVWLPGLVCGLNVTAQAFAQTGDEGAHTHAGLPTIHDRAKKFRAHLGSGSLRPARWPLGNRLGRAGAGRHPAHKIVLSLQPAQPARPRLAPGGVRPPR